MKIPEFKRSGIGLTAEFRRISNGFPNQGGQFEALEARCQVRHERGINSDELTVKDDDDNDNAEEAEDPQRDLALGKTRICKDTVNMFKRVLLFSQGAVEALYDNQMITTLDVL